MLKQRCVSTGIITLMHYHSEFCMNINDANLLPVRVLVLKPYLNVKPYTKTSAGIFGSALNVMIFTFFAQSLQQICFF